MIDLIPAIDLLDGKVVRLYKGDYNQVSSYGSPLEVAKFWADQGAKRIHVVDLDGAKAGKPVNLKQVEDIASTGMEVEFGGGIRSWDSLEHLFELGVHWAILGTVAVKDPEFTAQALRTYKERIILGLDARNGKVSVEGWLEDSELTTEALLTDLQTKGLRRFIYTDISKDGTLAGSDLDGMMALCAKFPKMQCILSGGVSNIEEIKTIVEYRDAMPNLEGIISGKALYEKKLDYLEAINILKS